MPYNVTLGELVERARQLGNQPTGNQIEIAEWKAHISSWYGKIHTIAADTGCRYFETRVALNLANLALPSDHKQTIGVDLLDASSRPLRELPQLMVQERNLFRETSGEARAWSFFGQSLELWPLPTTGNYRHLYLPQPTRYATASDATVVDTMTTEGYDAIVWGVASIALHRQESQQQRAIGEADAALRLVREWAIERAKGMPKRQVITDLDAAPWSIHGAWNPGSWRYNR
jgi:hypothetical protein